MLGNNFKIRQYGIIVKNTMQGPRRGASKVVKRSQHLGITMSGPIIMRPSLRMGETEPAERRGASIEAYQRELETRSSLDTVLSIIQSERRSGCTEAAFHSEHTRNYLLYAGAPIGIGQSSSVILLQKTQSATTAKSVNSVSNRAPLIFPSVA
jgi:hypothetical protein